MTTGRVQLMRRLILQMLMVQAESAVIFCWFLGQQVQMPNKAFLVSFEPWCIKLHFNPLATYLTIRTTFLHNFDQSPAPATSLLRCGQVVNRQCFESCGLTRLGSNHVIRTINHKPTAKSAVHLSDVGK